jgi:hypothetical protein
MGQFGALSIVLLLCMLSMAFPSQSILPLHPGTPASVQSESVGTTLYLSGRGQPSNVTLHVPLPSKALLESANLNISTPSQVGTGAGNVTLGMNGSGLLWGWNGIYGRAVLPKLEAVNGTAQSDLTVPAGTLTSGSALVRSSNGALGGNYVLNLTVGQSNAVSLSGSAGYLQPRALSWISDSNSISCVSVEPQFNGSQIVAVGDSAGYLQLYLVGASGTGYQVFTAPVSPPSAIQSLSFVDVANNGVNSVLTGAGNSVQLVTPGSGGTWKVLDLVLFHGVINGVVMGRYPNGNPVILALNGTDQIAVSNYSGQGPAGGWSNPMSIAMAFQGSATEIRSAELANGSTIVGLDLGNTVSEYRLTSAGLQHLVNVSLPAGVIANDIQFALNGSSLLMAASNGMLYQASAPIWQAGPLMSSPANSPLIGTSTLSSADSVIAVDSNGDLYLITSVNAGGRSTRLLGTVPLPYGGETLGFGSLLGLQENDAFVAGSEGVWVAQDETTFNATEASSWINDIENYITHSSPSSDSFGNSLYPVPVKLYVTNGGANVANGFVDYNYSRSIGVTKQVSQLFRTAKGELNVSFQANAQTAGYLHLWFILDVGIPSPPTFLNSFQSWFAQWGFYLVIALAGVGGTLLVLGSLRFWKSHTGR